MTAGIQGAFLLLAILQAAHSLEEYLFELWVHLAPARFVSGFVSDDLRVGFAVVNAAIVVLVFWSYLGPVRKATPGSRWIVWFWAILETLNGIGHLWFGVETGGYFPGLYTAPFLLVAGAYLLAQLSRSRQAA